MACKVVTLLIFSLEQVSIESLTGLRCWHTALHSSPCSDNVNPVNTSQVPGTILVISPSHKSQNTIQPETDHSLFSLLSKNEAAVPCQMKPPLLSDSDVCARPI